METDDKQVTTVESSNIDTEQTNELSGLDTKIDDSTSNTATEFENIQFPDEIFPINKNEPNTSADQSVTSITEDKKSETNNDNNKTHTDDNKMDYDFTSELLGNCDVGDMLTKTSEINSLADETTPNLDFPNLESSTNSNDAKSVEQNIDEIKETSENNETIEHSMQEVDKSVENTEDVDKIDSDNDDDNTINKSNESVNIGEDKIGEISEISQKTDDIESREKQPEIDDIEQPNDNDEEIKDNIENSNDIEKIGTDISDVSITSPKETEEEKGDVNINENDNETTKRIDEEKDFTDETETRTEEIVENKSPQTQENEETKEDMEDDMKMDTSDETTEKLVETVDKNDEVKDVEEPEKMATTEDTTEDKNDEIKEDLKETEKMDTNDDNMEDKTDEVKEDAKETEKEDLKDDIDDKKKTVDGTDKVEEVVEDKEAKEDKVDQEEKADETDDSKSETNIDEVSHQENEDDKSDKNDEKIDEEKAEDKIMKDTEDTDKSMDVDYGESKNVSEIDENSRDDNDDGDKDKDEQTNNIEYVDLGKEIIDDNKDDSQLNSLDNATNAQPEENPLLVDKDESNIEPDIEQETEQEQENENEQEETEQDQDQDKENTNKDDAVDDDTVASDEVITGLENADEALCMIPEQEPVQAEKDETFLTRGALTPPPPKEFTVKTSNSDSLETCRQCKLKRKASFQVTRRNQENGNDEEYVCSQTCLEVFKKENKDNYFLEYNQLRIRNFTKTPEMASMQEERACTFCKNKTDDEENNLTWELMDFCNEFCLWKYQKQVGSQCATCSVEVPPNSLGKYCVRFGDDIRQFCSSHCLEDYKKGLKVCSYCQQDMSKNIEGFLAPVGDKGQFKDFCSQKCMEKYDIMTNNRPPKVDKDTRCSVCDNDNDITIEFETKDGKNYFCSDRCFVAFSFVNNIIASRCSMCRRYYSNEILRKRTVFYDNVQYNFCSNSCHNIYIIAHRKIVPCAWCKVKKYNFDMIRRCFKGGTIINMCSIHCLNLFQVSINAVNSKKTLCNFCNKRHQPMYHLTMSDASIRNFCSYNCVMSFQNKFKKSPITLNNGNEESSYPVPAGEPKKSRKFALNDNTGKSVSPPLPVISSVQSLASKSNNQGGSVNGRNKVVTSTTSTTQITTTTTTTNNHQPHILNAGVTSEVGFRIKHHIIIKPAPIPEQRNVATMCKVRTQNKTTQYKPLIYDKAVQTDKEVQKAVVPVPVPLIVPTPNPLYCIPVPFPVAFPVPIPIPIFIPTTRNSAKGIMKEIKKIQVKIPTDPYEAELLMMAEMVAGDKKEENTDSESDVEDNGASGGGGTGGGGDEGSFSPEPVDASNTFGDDMLQMALKMATELEEPAVDLEGALTANTITASQTGEVQNDESVDDPQPLLNIPDRRGRKRGSRGGKQSSSGNNKRRRISQQSEACVAVLPPQPVAPPEPVEKPDAHLCLKYTFGVNAWKQWVTTKNQAEMEKSSKFVKPFKTEILQLTADELNYSLCLFVKEVRKPNGAEYAPDTIYYLCLGIQQYLFENGRIDNIFCDPYYEQFTDSLDEVARKFSVLYNDSHYIVTRVEEEHLWESKQLGAHSPHVLLSTLMFFNTKHFNLTTVEEHMQLSFSHIMKHWKRNPNQSGVARTPGSRNVLLRFYPPQSAMQNNARKKKVYEQQENEENPLRCPVKLYEFYLSKCPESVKTRNDVFYLQPERSCVPDSPVWYSTTALPREALEKMLHRVKMVKEINVALLTS